MLRLRFNKRILSGIILSGNFSFFGGYFKNYNFQFYLIDILLLTWRKLK